MLPSVSSVCIFAVMLAELVQSPVMAKQHKPERDPRPDDEVRYTALMTREDRARLRFFCERSGKDMERIGAQWILERLAQEERRLLPREKRE
jgi:hypothetical protein